ncbi:MAG TPA: NosD domain-containing protein, partial [Armatimonadota bacterium]|nr:NosD domain-containing protein [Armatimonadota bacterium]
LASCTNVVVRNCRSHDNDGCGIMLHMSCRHCLVEGNVFYRNRINGISLAIATDCAILNNLCWNNGLAADNKYAHIYVDFQVSWCNIQGNTCRYHDTVVRPKAGIEITNAGGGAVKNLVTNNDLLNSGVTPFINGGSATVTTAGNRVGSY